MEGTMLSDKVSADEGVRLGRAFSSCRGDGQQRPPVALLPTTFLRQPAPSFNADIFIVKQQQSNALLHCRSRMTADGPGFIIGLRRSPNSELAPEESYNANLTNEGIRHRPRHQQPGRHAQIAVGDTPRRSNMGDVGAIFAASSPVNASPFNADSDELVEDAVSAANSQREERVLTASVTHRSSRMASPSDRAGSGASTTSVKESELTFNLSSPSDPAANEVTLAPQIDASSQTVSLTVSTATTQTDSQAGSARPLRAAPSGLPPRLPGRLGGSLRAMMLNARRSASSRSGSSSSMPSQSSSRGSHHSDSPVGSGSTSCSSSDAGAMTSSNKEDIVIGGTDGTHFAWTQNPTGIWHRDQSRKELSLKDFLALPITDNGERVSFGSLVHVVDGQQNCKPCVQNRKRRGSCRFGVLCFFCHSEEHKVNARRPRCAGSTLECSSANS